MTADSGGMWGARPPLPGQASPPPMPHQSDSDLADGARECPYCDDPDDPIHESFGVTFPACVQKRLLEGGDLSTMRRRRPNTDVGADRVDG